MSNAPIVLEAFEQYLAIHNPQGLSREIGQLLASGDFSEETLADSYRNHGIADPTALKAQWLDLLLYYIQYCLSDHSLTLVEKGTIRILAGIFQIEEGDFYMLKWEETSKILTQELRRILENRDVDASEALQKVDLQAVFGLSYDQFLELTSAPANAIVDELITKITADAVVTPAEKMELYKQILSLDTVYMLGPKQQNAIDMITRKVD